MKKKVRKEIVEHVIGRTNWDMMAQLRTVACKEKGMFTSFLNDPDTLKQIGKNLLKDMLKRDVDYVSSGMLTAYRNDHGDGLQEIGIRFEAETTEATTYVENGKHSPAEDEDED